MSAATPEPSMPPLQAPTLPTARLRLRPFTAADTDAVFALQSDSRVLRYWDSPPWRERAQAERFIDTCRRLERDGSGVRLVIERARDGAFVGWCCLVRWNPAFRSAGIGYCLDGATWGQGYATEAASALLAWAFDHLDLNRVQAETDTRNTASARVLEKLGFVREGTQREDCIVDGDVSDSWVYGLLRQDWRASPDAVPRPAARIAEITDANPTVNEMEARVARFRSLQPTGDYQDAALPGCERTTFRVIGTTPAAPLAAEGFHLNIVRCDAGKAAPLHSHLTQEVFVALSGRWEVFWGPAGDRSVTLDPWDTVSIPPGLSRGFRNVATEPAYLMGLASGIDPGRIDWPASIRAAALAAGITLD